MEALKNVKRCPSDGEGKAKSTQGSLTCTLKFNVLALPLRHFNVTFTCDCISTVVTSENGERALLVDSLLQPYCHCLVNCAYFSSEKNQALLNCCSC